MIGGRQSVFLKPPPPPIRFEATQKAHIQYNVLITILDLE